MKKIAYTIADNNNLKYLEVFKKSLRKFHSEEELPLREIIGEELKNYLQDDPNFFYRATPIIASELFKNYDCIIKFDCDQIVTGSLNEIWDDEFDVATVLNDPSYPILLWDNIYPYFNNGLVVMKSKEFVNHWLRLCMSRHFQSYQFREQDLLNILASDYFDYKVKVLDNEKVYGEWAKPLWIQSYIKEDKIYLPYQDKELQLCIYHSGGGNAPDKMNYRIRFPEEVVKKIEELTK